MLTERDREILEVLTRRVRLLSLPQLARTWWPDVRHGLALAKDRMARLRDDGLVSLFSMAVHPELELAAPLCRWAPGDPAPDFKRLACRAQARWSSAPVAVTAASASPRAGGVFGAFPCRPPKRNEQTHDLHLSAVYLHKRRTHAEQAECWVPEQAVRATYEGYDDKVPDAWVERPRPTAIDFIGRYKAPRLRDLHGYCERRGAAYEFW